MIRLLELITNDDGRISRTQCMLWIAFLAALGLTIQHVQRAGLDAHALWMFAGIGALLLLDRMGARWLSMKIGAVHLQAGSEGAAK